MKERAQQSSQVFGFQSMTELETPRHVRQRFTVRP